MRRAAALLLLVLAAPASAGETTHSDDWYALYVNGTKAGHAHTVVLRVEDETAAETAPESARVSWVTTTDTYLKLARLDSQVELEISSRVTEDAAGRVTGFRQHQKVGGSEVVTTGHVAGAVLRLDQNGVRAEAPYPEGAIGPVATDRRVEEAGFEDGTRTTVTGFWTDSPATAADLSFTVEGKETLQVIDRRMVLHRIHATNSLSAARSLRLWFDGSARMQISESDIPGVGVLRMVRTTEKLARAVSSAAEIFATSLIEPDRGIAGARRARRAVFRLSRADGKPFDTELYEGEGQSVSALAPDGSRTVTIEAWTPPAGFRAYQRPLDVPGMERYLAKSAYLETDDPGVRRVAESVYADRPDALQCARRTEEFVRAFVEDEGKDVGFSSAAEVVRTRQGDCTEHAMLCAALARVAGLPSRVVMGIVYVPGMSTEGVGPRGAFGYHMWTEVLVGPDRWYPVDAALGGYDATHVALAKSDLATTSPVSQMVLPLLEAIASLRIQVVAVETDGDSD